MSRVLVLGVCPLPFENEPVSAPAFRTWQFIKPLVEDGHAIYLLAARDPAPGIGDDFERITEEKGFTYHALSHRKFMRLENIQEISDQFAPDCLISISSYSTSRQAAELKTDRPIWFDRTDLMAEAQLKSSLDGNDDYLFHFWEVEQMVLARGDIFSTISNPQRFALVGRLGGAGRLNRKTLGYEFVHAIPCGIEEETGKTETREPRLRGKRAGRDDFLVLWSGGYNTWTDVETLFSGLEKAMSRDARIKFVSAGGAIPGQDEVTYAKFLKLIEQSAHRDRFLMLGWLKSGELPSLYAESDLGINVDKNCYEVVLGSRQRLLEMIRAGLPILTTIGGEFVAELSRKELAFSFPQGDAGALADMIADLAPAREEREKRAGSARTWILENFNFSRTAEPLREWVRRPLRAPDRERGPVKTQDDQPGEDEPGRRWENPGMDYVVNLRNLESHNKNLESHNKNLEMHSRNLETIVKDREVRLAVTDAELKRLNKMVLVWPAKLLDRLIKAIRGRRTRG